MYTRKRFVTVLALGVVIAGLVAISTRHAAPTQAQGEGPRARRGPHIRASLYGLPTLSRGQTARLSAVNAVLGSPPEPVQPGEATPPERPRRVTLAFDIYEANPPDGNRPNAADGSVHTLRFLR